MATVKLPMMSLDASGAIGRAIVFSKWKGRNYIRKLVKPHQPRSGLQVGQRAAMKFLTKNWSSLTATIQGHWATRVAKKGLTALNSMTQYDLPLVRRNLGITQDYTVAAGAVEAAPTALAASTATKSSVITWVDSVGASDYCTFIYQSTVNAFTPSSATLVAIIAHGVQTYTAIKLITGTPYYWRAGGCEKGGTLGTLAAQVTATPT